MRRLQGKTGQTGPKQPVKQKTLRKVLTKAEIIRYTFMMQGHLCIYTEKINKICPIAGPFGGYRHEKNFSAQEASAQWCARLSEENGQQERPQGDRCPSCQGPRQAVCLSVKTKPRFL